jgi:CHAD domain-containing protein
MPGAIVDRFAVVRAHETRLTGRPPEQELHALRIHCKRLRYSLEFMRHLLGDEGKELIGQLKGLQDHLGDLNDACVTRDRLGELQRTGMYHPAIERYAQVQVQAVERLRLTFDDVWLPFVSQANRRLLMEAVSRL